MLGTEILGYNQKAYASGYYSFRGLTASGRDTALSGHLQQRVATGLDNLAELGVFGSLEGPRVVR